MGSSDDDMNKRKAEAAQNDRDKEEQWDAARLNGWHGTPWEDRTADGPPEHKAEPWYFWLAIGVMMIAILLPLLIELWGFLMAP